MLFKFLRVAFLATLLFSANSSFSQKKPPNSETYLDIIEKAYNLSLQKDRTQAMTILAAALAKETRPLAVNELKKTLLEVSGLFHKDKGQQLYEAGITFRKSDLGRAIDKFNEALQVEPDNTTIIKDLSRAYIGKADCSTAEELAKKYLKIISFDEELQLILIQSYACQNKWLEYQNFLEGYLPKKGMLHKYVLALEIKKQLSKKSITKASELIAELKAIDEKYPEFNYWSWKITTQQKGNAVNFAKKYLMACKNISINLFREYMIDPTLCRHVTEVEAETKGIANGLE